jgi:hypothetical protein
MTKKRIVTKGFLTYKSNPTQKALDMFFVYLWHLPAGWNHKKLCEPAVIKVREYFGWDTETGFDVMIMWGINVSAAKSKTSKGRYIAMSKAYHDARGMIGKGYVFTNKKL